MLGQENNQMEMAAMAIALGSEMMGQFDDPDEEE